MRTIQSDGLARWVRRAMLVMSVLPMACAAGSAGRDTVAVSELAICPPTVLAVSETHDVIDRAALQAVLTRAGREVPAVDVQLVPTADLPELVNRSAVGRVMEGSYPKNLRDAGLGGESLLLLLITEDGRVGGTTVSKTSGRVQIDQASVDVARVMEFTPAVINGCRAAFLAEVPIVWSSVDRFGH